MDERALAMRMQKTGQIACHVRVKDVAKAAAGELYESMMGQNEYFDAWKKQNPGATDKQLEKRFIERNWPRCIEFARATLTIMLTRDDISENMKDEIMDILHKDQFLRSKVPSGQLMWSLNKPTLH